MLETPHVLVGAAIAVKVGHPLLAIPLAFTSHFLLEQIPHWNPHLKKETDRFGQPTPKSTAIVVIDSTLALISGSLIAFTRLPDIGFAVTVLLSSLAAVLPDLVEAPYFFLRVRHNRLINRWIKFQKNLQVNAAPLPGLATQLVVILATLGLILAK